MRGADKVPSTRTVLLEMSPNRSTRFNNRRRFTSESSNPSVPMSFAVYLDLRGLSMCLSPSSSDKHSKVVAVHCHSHIQIWIVEQRCTVFAFSDSAQLSTDQVHILNKEWVSVWNSHTQPRFVLIHEFSQPIVSRGCTVFHYGWIHRNFRVNIGTHHAVPN